MSEPAYPDALPALSRLHWYVLERVLGQGGFGITYLAKDTNLDQRVAIKEYLPVEVATRLPDSTVRSRTEELRDRYRWGLERFIQEARTLARFDHPNIVRVLSVFEFNNTAYMVMRFEEGGTLSAMLDRRGTLPEADLVRILLPILDGLELVHNAGFIHRDIKPDNIHIGGDGRPVLLDFGSARQSVGSSNTLTILIAPGYAPFEQYYSDPSAQGPWTDIYGLGATCYRAICGRAPLDAVSRSKGILGSTQEVMVPASVIGAGRYSGKLLAAIDHALAFAEKDRPQNIAEWRRELADESVGPAGATRPADSGSRTRAAAQATTLPAEGIPAARAARPEPIGAPPVAQAPQRAAGIASTGYWKPALAVAAIAAIGAAIYFVAGKNDETQHKIAELQKQIKEKETADAERERKAKAQADEETRLRKSQEQARIEEKTPAEASRRQEVSGRQAEAQKKNPAPKSPVAAEPSIKRSPSGVPETSSSAKEKQTPAPSPAAESPRQIASVPAPSPATEPPKQAGPTATPAPESPKQTTPAPAATPAQLLAEADRAISENRYDGAIKVLKPLSEAGNARAQSKLADLYATGRGVERDLSAAARLYERAAVQGDTAAEVKLGDAYVNGTGVLQSNYLAYVWYGTAVGLGANAAEPKRDKVATMLQPAEVKQANRVIENNLDRIKKHP